MRFSEIGHSPGVDSYIESIKQKKGATNAIPFEYVDPASAHLFILVRLEFTDRSKSFTVFRVVGDQIVNGMPELNSIPLYGITEVVSHMDAPVYLVEGEKKADRLREAGLVAVSPFGGARNVRRADLLPLAGRICILLPDDGDGGRNWTRELGARLNDMQAEVYAITMDHLLKPGEREKIAAAVNKQKLDIHDIYDAGEAVPGVWQRILFTLKNHYRQLGGRCVVMLNDLEKREKNKGHERITRTTLVKRALKELDIIVENHRSVTGKYGWLLGHGYVNGPYDNVSSLGVIYNSIADELDANSIYDQGIEHTLIKNIDVYCSTRCDIEKLQHIFKSAACVDKIATTHAAMLNERLYYNLNNGDGDVVVVSADGIHIRKLKDVINDGIAFTSLSECPETNNTKCEIPASLAQAIEYVTLLRPMLNPHLTDTEFTGLISFMLFSLRDDMPQQILALEGEAGSGKTTTAETICMLIDPPVNRIEKMDDKSEAILKCVNHRVVLYDNVWSLTTEVADALCTHGTSPTLEWRPLHTNTLKLVDGYKAYITTSTHPIWGRSDVGDRMLVINHKRIRGNCSFNALERNRLIKDNRGKILGGLFYLFMQGLRYHAHESVSGGIEARNSAFIKFARGAMRGTPWYDKVEQMIIESNEAVRETLTNTSIIEAVNVLLDRHQGVFIYRTSTDLRDAMLRALGESGRMHLDSCFSKEINKYQRMIDMISEKPDHFLRELKASKHALTRADIRFIEDSVRPRAGNDERKRYYFKAIIRPSDQCDPDKVASAIQRYLQKLQKTEKISNDMLISMARRWYELVGLAPAHAAVGLQELSKPNSCHVLDNELPVESSTTQECPGKGGPDSAGGGDPKGATSSGESSSCIASSCEGSGGVVEEDPEAGIFHPEIKYDEQFALNYIASFRSCLKNNTAG